MTNLYTKYVDSHPDEKAGVVYLYIFTLRPGLKKSALTGSVWTIEQHVGLHDKESLLLWCVMMLMD